jgi:glutaredoxin
MITTFAVLAVFAASLFISTQNGGGITGAFSAVLPAQQAAEKAIGFINNDLLGGQSTATLVNVTEKSGLYLVTFKVDTQTYSTYVSKDGKFLFPQSLDMTEVSTPAATTEPVTAAVPTVQFFVMSFCPYGQQAEAGLKPVADLLGAKATFEPHFIVSVSGDTVSSLHGQYEVNEDMRQAVILKHYGTATFWKYVDYLNNNCNKDNVDACWKDAAKASSVDTAKVEGWVTAEGLDLMKAEAALTGQLGVTGSPTIFINGAPYGGSDRSPGAFQTAICGAFTSKPAECSQTLSSNASTASGNCDTG